MSPAGFMRAYEAVTNAHDLDATLELIADNAVYLFSDQTAHVGKNAIRDVLRANFDTIKYEVYRIEDLTWLAVSDDVATCVYEFHWSGEIDGRPAGGSGRGTSVICRIDGKWRVVHEHLSRGRLRNT